METLIIVGLVAFIMGMLTQMLANRGGGHHY